jgi:hypothetical protein
MSVASLTSSAQAYAASTLASSDTAIREALAAVQLVGYTGLSYNPVALPALPQIPDELTAPELADVPLDLPVEPDDTLIFQDISPVEAGEAPTLTATLPTLTLPTQPSALSEFQVAVPDVNTSFTFPEPPAVLMNPLIEAPVLTERVEPAAPQVLLPAFTATMPDDIPDAPTGLQTTFDNAYNGAAPSTIAMMDGYVDALLTKHNPRFAEQMGRIETQLATYLDGGTGFDAAAETAIYERARSKGDAEARRTRDTAYRDAADRGFTLPPAAVTAGVRQARQAAADVNAAAAREIVVLQAEMEQKNLQFAVTTSANLRTTLLSAALSYHQNLIQINGQALEYARSILGAVIETYNTAVKAYTVRLDGYRAEAAVHETKLKSAMAAIELYRAEIQALEAMTNVDRTRVAIYEARISALTALSNVYRAQIEAVQGRAGLEKLKLDVFGAQVQAFTSKVQAKNAEWLGYKSSIDGQQAVAGLYGEQVKAFGIQTDAWGREISAKAEVARAQALTNQSRGENFRAVWAAYTSTVEARGAVARTRLENNRQEVIGFQAASQAQIARAQLYSDYYRTTGEIAIKNAGLSIEAIVKSAEIQRSFGNSIATLATANAQVHGQLASAAVSGMNTLAAETLSE